MFNSLSYYIVLIFPIGIYKVFVQTVLQTYAFPHHWEACVASKRSNGCSNSFVSSWLGSITEGVKKNVHFRNKSVQYSSYTMQNWLCCFHHLSLYFCMCPVKCSWSRVTQSDVLFYIYISFSIPWMGLFSVLFAILNHLLAEYNSSSEMQRTLTA